MKRIELIISPKGETQIESSGFSGDECREATRSLEKALGIRESESLTPEFYANQPATQQEKEQE